MVLAVLGSSSRRWRVGGSSPPLPLGSLTLRRVGFSPFLLSVEAALVFDAGETGLDLIELGGGLEVLVARREDFGDLFLRVRDAVGGLRVIGEGSGDGSGLVLLEVFNFFEEGDEGCGVVSGAIHVLDAEVVGLSLKLAGEFEEGQGDRRGFRPRRCRSRSSRR